MNDERRSDNEELLIIDGSIKALRNRIENLEIRIKLLEKVTYLEDVTSLRDLVKIKVSEITGTISKIIG